MNHEFGYYSLPLKYFLSEAVNAFLTGALRSIQDTSHKESDLVTCDEHF